VRDRRGIRLRHAENLERLPAPTPPVVPTADTLMRAGTMRQSWALLAGSIQSPLDGAAGACCSPPAASTLPVALLAITY
jgi:hypothetical protein